MRAGLDEDLEAAVVEAAAVPAVAEPLQFRVQRQRLAVDAHAQRCPGRLAQPAHDAQERLGRLERAHVERVGRAGCRRRVDRRRCELRGFLGERVTLLGGQLLAGGIQHAFLFRVVLLQHDEQVVELGAAAVRIVLGRCGGKPVQQVAHVRVLHAHDRGRTFAKTRHGLEGGKQRLLLECEMTRQRVGQRDQALAQRRPVAGVGRLARGLEQRIAQSVMLAQRFGDACHVGPGLRNDGTLSEQGPCGP